MFFRYLRRLALAVTLSLYATPALPYAFMETDGGEWKRWWTQDLSFTLGALDSKTMDMEVVAALMQDFFDDWRAAPCQTVPTVLDAGRTDATLPTPPAYNDTTGLIDSDNVLVFAQTREAWQGTLNLGSSTLAITLVGHDDLTGRIYDADFFINEYHHTFTTDDTPAQGEILFKTLMIHEIGHFFGLDHSNAPGAVMQDKYNAAFHALTQDDLDGICALYTDVPTPPETPDTKSGCQLGLETAPFALLFLLFPFFRRLSSVRIKDA